MGISTATCGAKRCDRFAIKNQAPLPGTSPGTTHLTCPEGLQVLAGRVGRAKGLRLSASVGG